MLRVSSRKLMLQTLWLCLISLWQHHVLTNHLLDLCRFNQLRFLWRDAFSCKAHHWSFVSKVALGSAKQHKSIHQLSWVLRPQNQCFPTFEQHIFYIRKSHGTPLNKHSTKQCASETSAWASYVPLPSDGRLLTCCLALHTAECWHRHIILL